MATPELLVLGRILLLLRQHVELLLPFGGFVGAFSTLCRGLRLGGDRSLAALCGKEGRIIWADTSKLTVVSVDSQSPQKILEAS